MEKQIDYVFITGMFRSGTTLLGRMLNAHKNIAIASDPCMPLFKNFRSDIAKEIGQEVPTNMPLDDYYFSKDKLNLKESIESATFEFEFKNNSGELKKQLVSHGSPFCPKLTENVEKINGRTYTELLESILCLTREQYGDKKTRVVGFKDVWTDEFIRPLSKSFPNMKFIQILRDPRAVASSKNSRKAKYPWIFLARQWRKLASYAWHYQNDKFQKPRVLLIYYEDLIREPERAAKNICSYLNLEYDSNMVDLDNYVDGEGKSWRQNTAYGQGEKKFNEKNIDKWRSVLKEEEVKLIELFCQFEMNLHNYECDNHHKEIPSEFIFNAPKIQEDNLADWIKKLIKNDELSSVVEMNKETLRYSLVHDKKDSNIDIDLSKGCFLFSDMYNWLKVKK